jgi:hypothetical protein
MKEEERESWLNQKANDHDNRIRKAERESIVKEIRETIIWQLKDKKERTFYDCLLDNLISSKN